LAQDTEESLYLNKEFVNPAKNAASPQRGLKKGAGVLKMFVLKSRPREGMETG